MVLNWVLYLSINDSEAVKYIISQNIIKMKTLSELIVFMTSIMSIYSMKCIDTYSKYNYLFAFFYQCHSNCSDWKFGSANHYIVFLSVVCIKTILYRPYHMDHIQWWILYRQHGPILFCMRLSDEFYFTDADSLGKNK